MAVRTIASVLIVVGLAAATTIAAPPSTTAAPAPAATTGGGTDAGVPDANWLAVDPVLGHAQHVDGDESSGVVAFTFDDGPSPETTPDVLAALEKYDVPASFFIVARRIVGRVGRPSRALLAREDREGFTIGCHSWSHLNLKHSTADQAKREVDQAQKVIAHALGRPIGLFRPPYGSLGGAAAMTVARRGLTDVLWSIDTLDWRARDPQKLRKKVLRMILTSNGGVVLMHDTKKMTASIIASVLDDLEAENCARLGRGAEPIVPVSIHYFLTDGKTLRGKGKPRPVPPEIAARTSAYRAALPARCAARPVPLPALPATPAAPAPPATPATSTAAH
jgi:peptidoglycan/xylan/chitin deacetylase (PgdA/CDA1 family)